MEHLGLGWERNIWLPSCTNLINRHQHQQQIEETLVFDSQDLFSNYPIQDNSAAHAAYLKANPAKNNMDSVNVASNFDAPNQTLTTATAFEAPIVTDCFLSDHDDVIFPYYNKNSCNNNYIVSSGDSFTKEMEMDDHSNNRPRSKKPRLDPGSSTSTSTIDFRRQGTESDETDSEAIAQMKEMIYRAAAFRPVTFADEEVVEKPKRRNVRISSDPQTVAARQRREKISERIRVLQKLVPGGNKLDTASMLDEAANYLKFLRSQVKALEKLDHVRCSTTGNAESTSQRVQNVVDPGNVTVTVGGVPFPMQSHVVLLPYQHHHPA